MPRYAFLLVVLAAAGCAADSPTRYSATTAAMEKDATAAAGEPRRGLTPASVHAFIRILG